MKRVTPTKTVALSAYYDSASDNHLRDFGNPGLGREDRFFSESVRSVAIARLRREVRNNPFLAGLLSKFPEAMGASRLRSTSSDKEYNAAKDLFWKRWGKSVATDGSSLSTIEELIWTESLVAGELFFVLHPTGKIQPIPSEFCGSPFSPHNRNPNELNGVILNRFNRATHYRFGREDALGLIDYSEKNSTVVPARYVFHWYRKDRVHMSRGLPWLNPSLPHARDLFEITTAKTKQIKDANKFSGTIEKEDAAKFLEGLTPSLDSNHALITEDGDSPADASQNEDAAEDRIIELKDGTFIALEPGEKLNLLMSQYHAEDYKELVMLMLHAISSPIGLPVELWFSGLSEVNYSGFKGLGSQWTGRRKHYHRLEEDKFLGPLHFWRQSKATNEGDLPDHPDGDEDRIQWKRPAPAVLDEEREAKANKTKLESGEEGLEDIWERSQGRDPDEVFAKRRETYVKAKIASGELEEGTDPDAIQVPLEFLLYSDLPGRNKSASNLQPPPDNATSSNADT